MRSGPSAARALLRQGRDAETWIDLTLRMDGTDSGGRLLDRRNTAGRGLSLRMPLRSVGGRDAEAVVPFGRMRRASR